jgi:alpha-L-arabinofuranosidase
MIQAAVLIDPTRAQHRIDPAWFGHNLEPTRRSVSGGLSAQLLRNRKFAGYPQPRGQAQEWTAVGPATTMHELVTRQDARSPHEVFTRHADDSPRNRRFEAQAQWIHALGPGGRSGIAQDGLMPRAGVDHALLVVARASQPLVVEARLGTPSDPGCFARLSWQLEPGAWQRLSGLCAVPAAAECRLTIDFQGAGDLGIGCVSLLPSDHLLGMRADVVAALRQMRIPLLRWPGGNYAGDYRWQDGLLDRDERAPLGVFQVQEGQPYTRGYDDHEMGIDEFMALCRHLDAEPLLTINIGWEGPADAASWVAYCNADDGTQWGRVRRERGHAEPFHVRRWCLGNEMGYGHMEGPNDPGAYCAKAIACAVAMRAVDVGIELVASGLWGHADWLAQARTLAEHVQMVSVHSYPRQSRWDAGTQRQAEISRIRAAAYDAAPWMARVHAGIVQACAAVDAPAIAFDEWNLWQAWCREPGITDGIFAAAFLHTLCRDAPRMHIGLACYFQPVNEGALLVDPGGVRMTAAGRAFALLAPHQGAELLAIECADADGSCDVVASRSPGGAITVTVLALRGSAPQRVEIRLREQRIASWRVSGLGAPDALPGTELRPLEGVVETIEQSGPALALMLPAIALVRLELIPG